jgi:rhodanese-related sulfurtransferase
MSEVMRIHPSDARIKVQRGEALLVCAYEEPESWLKMRLEGSIPLRDFQALAPTLDRDREIVFYCS